MADDSLYPPTKYCRTCKEHKALSEFYKRSGPNRTDGIRSRCKACELAAQYKKRMAHFPLTEDGFKICTACAQAKPLSEFYPQKNKRDGVRSHCIPCVGILQRKQNKEAVRRYYAKHRKERDAACRQWAQKHIEQIRAYDSLRHRKRLEQKWAAMGATPRPDACEICGSTKEMWTGRHKYLLVDHCHKTGLFRGWLCDRCNRVLGIVEDQCDVLRKMADYLEKSSHAMDQKTGKKTTQ